MSSSGWGIELLLILNESVMICLFSNEMIVAS